MKKPTVTSECVDAICPNDTSSQLPKQGQSRGLFHFQFANMPCPFAKSSQNRRHSTIISTCSNPKRSYFLVRRRIPITFDHPTTWYNSRWYRFTQIEPLWNDRWFSIHSVLYLYIDTTTPSHTLTFRPYIITKNMRPNYKTPTFRMKRVSKLSIDLKSS